MVTILRYIIVKEMTLIMMPMDSYNNIILEVFDTKCFTCIQIIYFVYPKIIYYFYKIVYNFTIICHLNLSLL